MYGLVEVALLRRSFLFCLPLPTLGNARKHDIIVSQACVVCDVVPFSSDSWFRVDNATVDADSQQGNWFTI